MNKLQDMQYEDVRISEVTKEKRGFTIKREDGWVFFSPSSKVIPHVGGIARFYGKGVGYTVRGLDIDGVEVFYRTPEQEEEKFHKDIKEDDRKKKLEFKQNKSKLDRSFNSLPLVFQERISKFRRTNPDFRWQFEPYELFVCEQAVEIAKALAPYDKKVFVDFRKMIFKEQKLRVPKLSDEHSGNTFAISLVLAEYYLINPDFVVREHGAMTPLVGCEKYGCPH